MHQHRCRQPQGRLPRKRAINSVKSTRKITSAMKMVAASKLRRAQTQAEAARPYAERMQRCCAALAASAAGHRPRRRACWSAPGRTGCICWWSVTADRGLAGAFNTNVGRAARSAHPAARGRGQEGQGADRRPQGPRLPAPRIRQPHRRRISFAGKKRIEFADVNEIAERVTQMLDGRRVRRLHRRSTTASSR